MAQILAPLHDAFESSDLIMPRLSTREGYIGVLQAMFNVHAAAEPRIDAYRSEFARRTLAVGERMKLQLIATELQELGVAHGMQTRAPQTAFDSFAQAWGWLYVLEGSSLGGVVLAKEVRRQLGHTTKYYGCYGSNTMPMWRAFGSAFDAYMTDEPQAFDAALAGARACYSACTAALTYDCSER